MPEDHSSSSNRDRHYPINEEIFFISDIAAGNVEQLDNDNIYLHSFGYDALGSISKDPLTDHKYRFVMTVSIISMSCIEQGLSSGQAVKISSHYFRKLDDISDSDDLLRLQAAMIMEFADEMRLVKKQTGMSRAVRAAITYIHEHITARITIDDLAAHTEISRSHLSRMFRKETGLTVSDYIRKQKMDTARQLLHYSDYTLAEIASYLSFSSQSHFTQTFVKYEGMTPKQYRDMYNLRITDIPAGAVPQSLPSADHQAATETDPQAAPVITPGIIP